jgi:hypothetical protein
MNCVDATGTKAGVVHSWTEGPLDTDAKGGPEGWPPALAVRYASHHSVRPMPVSRRCRDPLERWPQPMSYVGGVMTRRCVVHDKNVVRAGLGDWKSPIRQRLETKLETAQFLRRLAEVIVNA